MNKPTFSILLLILFLVAGVAGAEPAGKADADKGVQLYQQRRYQEAIEHLRRGLEAGVEPANEADLWTILGNAYDSLEDYPNAIDAHKRALETDPKSYIAWTNLGAVHRHDGNYSEARECYQKALDLNPDYPEAHASMGALHIFEGRLEQAVESLERAIELDRSQPVSHANISVAYARLGRFEQAQESLDRATSLGYRNTATIQKLIDDEKANAK